MLSRLFTTYERDMAVVCDVQRCTCQAVWIVSIHQCDRCDKFPQSGCLHAFMCDEHTEKARELTKSRMKQMGALLPDDQIWVRCNACGIHFKTIDDACRVESLVAL